MGRKPAPVKDGLRCIRCDQKKKLSDFPSNKYAKNNNGKEMYCRKCRDAYITDLNKLVNYVEQHGIKFSMDTFNKAKETAEKKDFTTKTKEEKFAYIVGRYFALLNLPQNAPELIEYEVKKEEEFENNKLINDDFEITPDLLEKWGEGYKKEEYYLFEKKYNRLIRSYSAKTEMHSEALLIYIRYRVKEEMASAKGDVKEAKQWGELASKAALDAKINPAQMSKSDISGGIDVVTQIFEAVESEVGVIPFLPKLLEQPYDDADMVIWSIVNYTRRLEEKPIIKYRDIYNFYDEMLKEHYKANGWNEEQIEIFLKKRNNVFRDLEEVYIEPLYSKQSYEDGEE